MRAVFPTTHRPQPAAQKIIVPHMEGQLFTVDKPSAAGPPRADQRGSCVHPACETQGALRGPPSPIPDPGQSCQGGFDWLREMNAVYHGWTSAKIGRIKDTGTGGNFRCSFGRDY